MLKSRSRTQTDHPLEGLARAANRAGISLMELLVVTAVFGILMALVIPAMMSARLAAQKAQCTSNLKQIGIALNSYESEWNQYPNGLTFKYSLLPYLGHDDVYQRGESTAAELTDYEPVRDAVIPVYYCPADWAPMVVAGSGRANYAGCFGSGALTDGLNGIFLIWHSRALPPALPVNAASVLDGLSNTAAVSEFLCATNDTNAVLRVLWNTPRKYTPTEADAFARFCAAIPQEPTSFGYRGIASLRGQWFDGNYGHGLYNHVLTPNQPSCLNYANLRTGISTATSLHPNGVNLLFADGHVRFVSDSIDRAAWREFASRDSRLTRP